MSATNQFDAYMAGEQERNERTRQRLALIHASGKTALDWALEQIERSGRRVAINTAKSFARQFKRAPQKLNSLSWNLSQAEPADGIREIRRIARQDGDTHLLVGAMIFFRWARRHERAVDRGYMLAAE